VVPIHRILVPVNFTESCRAAALFASDLAADLDAELRIVHVLEPAGSAIGFETATMFEASLQSFREQARRTLDGFVDGHMSDRIQRVLLEGDPAGEIVRFAHNEKCELILMPTHGYGVFRRLLLGSVTAKVLHDADCPVWTGVHPEATNTDGEISIRRIACAVDLGPQTASALRWAASFAKHWHAPLTVIHVLPQVPDESWRERLARLAREQLLAYQTDLGVEAELCVEPGRAEHAVPELATRAGADLLVIARGHVARARLGGGAYAIVRDSAVPVVSV
jgi:nucleotide-binding universal stress UspA family protein